ncbi:holo-ACP synthase [Desulfocucumis palustris]|uniref:holo-ACP synthase n=1 Tax=Desulfocucumis palustris TaxID=1898651 RepID=UPI0040391DE3
MLGIGTDIIEIERIEKAVNRYGFRFLNRVYTAAETGLCSSRKDPYPCYAARFAAKEAVLKALGTGLAGCRWTDVEVCGTPSGAPEVKLAGRAVELAGAAGVTAVLLSLSHDRGRAVAFAVALKGGMDFAYRNSTGNEGD